MRQQGFMTLNQHRRVVDELLAAGQIEEARAYCRRMPYPASGLCLSRMFPVMAYISR